MVSSTDLVDDMGQSPTSLQYDKAELDSICRQAEMKIAEIKKLLNFGKSAEAISVATKLPPDRRLPKNIQDKIINSAILALSEANPQTIPTMLKTFSIEDSNTIIKFIYRGLARPELYNSSILLTWHEQIVNFAGLGTIMAALTER